MSAFDELDAEEQKSAFDELDAEESAPVSPPAPSAPTTERTNAAEAAGVGALNAATFGFNDEIGGGVNALMQWAGLVPEIPRSSGRGDMTGANTSGYDAERNRQRELNAAAAEEHPVAYTGAQIATGIAGSGGFAGGGRAAVGRLAAEGAGQGVGDSEAESAQGVLKDAGKGAATTLGTAGVLKGAGKVGQSIGKTAPAKLAKAKIQRLMAAGINPKNKQQMGAHTVDQQADYMKSAGIGKAKWGFIPASTEEIAAQADEAVERTDAARDAIADQLKGTPVQAGQVGTKLRHQVKAEQGPVGRRAETNAWPETPKMAAPAQAPAATATAPGGRRLKKPAHDPATAPTALPSLPPVPVQAVPPPRNVKVRNPEYEPIRSAKLERAGYFDAIGDQPFEVMNDLRKQYGGRAKFGTDTPAAAVRQDVHGAINDVMESAAGPKGSEWRKLGQDEAMALRARGGAEGLLADEARGGLSRADIGMGVLGVGIGSAADSGIMGGMGAMLMSRGMRGRGKSALAATSEISAKGRSAAGAVGRALDAAAPRSGALGRSILNVQQAETPEERAKAHFLESSTNPEYRDYTHRTE